MATVACQRTVKMPASVSVPLSSVWWGGSEGVVELGATANVSELTEVVRVVTEKVMAAPTPKTTKTTPTATSPVRTRGPDGGEAKYTSMGRSLTEREFSADEGSINTPPGC